MDSTMIDNGMSLLEKISIVNPVMGLLLFVLLLVIYYQYKDIKECKKQLLELQKSKEAEVKELNNILLQVRETDKEMLMELKNVISRHADIDKEHAEAFQKLITKLEILFTKI